MAIERGRDLFDFPNMSDDEVREIVVEYLQDAPNLDADDIDVEVNDGVVRLSGRVGTDTEVRVAEALLDDVLGIDAFSNELVIDELRRAEAEDTEEVEGFGALDSGSQQSDTAEHLVEDLDAETLGTRDVGQAIREAAPYSPPDGPVGDGYGSGENH